MTRRSLLRGLLAAPVLALLPSLPRFGAESSGLRLGRWTGVLLIEDPPRGQSMTVHFYDDPEVSGMWLEALSQGVGWVPTYIES